MMVHMYLHSLESLKFDVLLSLEFLSIKKRKINRRTILGFLHGAYQKINMHIMHMFAHVS